jgi:N4-(beta-N-acetylglucosaminyl)-L-asparaginase
MSKVSRRTFVATGMGAAALGRAIAQQSPAVITRGPAKPVVVASANGNRFKNGGTMTGVEKAFTMMTSEGADVLDALIAGVNIVELDPLDDSVGYGGLPNAEGIVQLDAGLYVDGDAGAAGSTGRGEANLYNLSSFLAVENMRRG